MIHTFGMYHIGTETESETDTETETELIFEFQTVS